MNTPLRIDALQLSCGGEIGMTLCPGKSRLVGFPAIGSATLQPIFARSMNGALWPY